MYCLLRESRIWTSSFIWSQVIDEMISHKLESQSSRKRERELKEA
jgi:hypothetical protein